MPIYQGFKFLYLSEGCWVNTVDHVDCLGSIIYIVEYGNSNRQNSLWRNIHWYGEECCWSGTSKNTVQANWEWVWVIFRCANISTGFSPVRPVIPFSIFKTFFKSFTFLKLVWQSARSALSALSSQYYCLKPSFLKVLKLIVVTDLTHFWLDLSEIMS